jgi:hypothetical protein
LDGAHPDPLQSLSFIAQLGGMVGPDLDFSVGFGFHQMFENGHSLDCSVIWFVRTGIGQLDYSLGRSWLDGQKQNKGNQKKNEFPGHRLTPVVNVGMGKIPRGNFEI